jgi:hypothetical protein
MIKWSEQIDERLAPFKRKYFKRLLIKGFLISGGSLLAYLLIATLSESVLWMSNTPRFLTFLLFFILTGYCYYRYLHRPLVWFLFGKGLKSEEAAALIGKSDSEVNDQLLNLIQLTRQESSALSDASIVQRFTALRHIRFEKQIDLRSNRKYIPLFIAPLIILFFFIFLNVNLFTGSISRIVQFNKEFVPEAPFQFRIKNHGLTAYAGEDFTLVAELAGASVPSELYLQQNELLQKFHKNEDGSFSFLFEKLQSNRKFQLYSAGFYSTEFELTVVSRPALISLKSILKFPAYLGLKSIEINNSGNLEIPEGTTVTWLAELTNAKSARIHFSSGSSEEMKSAESDTFEYRASLFKDTDFKITLSNDSLEGSENISYQIKVIPDELPSLQVKQATDSILFKRIFLGGAVEDDHGITRLEFSWKNSGSGNNEKYNTRHIPVNRQLKRQEFLYVWKLDSLSLQPGESLDYFVEVWDNDGVHGPKSVRSGIFNFKVPGLDVLDQQLKQSENRTGQKIDEGKSKAKSLSESIEEVRKKLRGKQSVEWQDKALLEDIIRQKQEMEKSLEELARQNQKLNDQRNSINEADKRIMEKTQQLQELMENLLDEKTKELFRELEKLLRENAGAEQMQKMLDKIERNEINVEKELDRIKELFKQLQLESKVDQSLKRLQEHIDAQEMLLKKTEQAGEEKNRADALKDLAGEQERIKENWEQEEKNFEDLEEMAKEAGEDAGVPDSKDVEETGMEMDKSGSEMKSGDGKKSGEAQRKAIQKMKAMQQQMQNRQEGMSMELDMAIMESMRQILHGLVKLSFDQERTMKSFGAVQSTDPAYLGISQSQIKLQDDSKVLIDSLLALGKKDVSLGSFVTREVGELNYHLERSSTHIRERRKQNASSEMQLSMTSLNNLALMLNDHYQQMMEMMSKPGKGKGSKKNQKPSLSEMQQSLNKQIEEIRKGGKSGRELSEELGKLAAEQERIRKALQNLQQKMEQEGGQKPGGDIPGKMEQTELDLVNKNITEQTIRRQKEILNRLLESEKSVREQEFDEERKGETAKEYEQPLPGAFKEYLRIKEKEVEFLKTIPPKLYPYYKKEVNEYFERLAEPSKRNK